MILTEGARVRLRMMRRGDADELYALLSDEAVMRWLEPPFTREQTVSAHIARRHGFSYEGRADSRDVYRLRCEK